MANEPVILVTMTEGIATITLNKPEKRNAMDGVLVANLMSVLAEIATNKNIGVIILRANGEHFCAGADIAWMQKIATAPEADNQADALQLAKLMYAIYTYPKPVIVLAHGATLGGGLGLVAACDIAIAANNASFAFSEVKIGIVPSVVSPYVIKAMGERAARYYFLTAARFGADEAHRIGFVHQVVDPQALNSVGVTIANEILKHSRSAVSEAKRLIQTVASEKVSDDLIRYTAEHLATMRTTADAREGLQAFLEKRMPTWS
ncbi:MAG: enoyl-CoA hydratase-related protein [Gammaproteobacteria bacterium]|nr:enoyl-CoA hydratase-related protein [Gammaproteobacteria bacterium]